MTDVFDKQTLELTLRASNEGIWDWDINSGEIYYSDRILNFLGYEQYNAPNLMTDPESVLHHDSLDYFQNILSLTLLDSDEEHLGIDCKIQRPDGSQRWIRIRGAIIRNAHSATRIAGSMIDISKRKFAEEMVAEERNMLRLIIDNIPLQVYFKDTESNYKLVNQRQVEWLGQSDTSQVIGKSGKSFFSEESWQTSREEELQIMQSGIPVIDVIQREKWPNKPDTYVQKVKHPWHDSSGKLLGTYGIACDVTSLIQAKKKLEHVAVDLQQQNKNYQEELMLATEVQRAILPENSPEWGATITEWKNRIHIETLYVPASDLAGDFYDVIRISDQKIGFLMIDVSGHGVRSAIIISLIRGLTEQAEHIAHKPAAYLNNINKGLIAILEKSSISLHASACYTLIDFETKKVTITSAGHDYPLIHFKNGSPAEPISHQKGSALGIHSPELYLESTFQINHIKNILMFTNGIYTVTNKDKEKWGIKKLQQAFTDAQKDNITTTAKYIHNQAKQWARNNIFKDDVCLLHLEIR